jgi:class 3 adenylate cyclase
MFIDVVGFSLIAEKMLPRAAFENLKSMLARVGETVHEHGGVIDKTLGDGLLCYFGYRFDRDTTSPDHAEKALLCARKIQEDNILRNIQAAENNEPVYPLRIGINTASCYLGDLGSESRIDFTLVGNGVNFAKRLEGACEMHSVLLGATTYDLVRGILLSDKHFSRRLIQIKHHSELVEAYEFDPFVDQQELRKVATHGFRKCVNVERVEIRRPVPESSRIGVATDFGAGRLVNFSQKGLALSLPQLLAKGTRLSIMLDTPGGALRTQLAKDNLDVLHGEVRWGYAEGDRFVHGIAIGNLTESQGRALLQTLIEFVFAGQKPSDQTRIDKHEKAA